MTTAVSQHLLVSHATHENRDTTLSTMRTAGDPFHCLLPVHTYMKWTNNIVKWNLPGLDVTYWAGMQAQIQQTVPTLYMAKHDRHNLTFSQNSNLSRGWVRVLAAMETRVCGKQIKTKSKVHARTKGEKKRRKERRKRTRRELSTSNFSNTNTPGDAARHEHRLIPRPLVRTLACVCAIPRVWERG